MCTTCPKINRNVKYIHSHGPNNDNIYSRFLKAQSDWQQRTLRYLINGNTKPDQLTGFVPCFQITSWPTSVTTTITYLLRCEKHHNNCTSQISADILYIRYWTEFFIFSAKDSSRWMGIVSLLGFSKCFPTHDNKSVFILKQLWCMFYYKMLHIMNSVSLYQAEHCS